VARKKKLAPPKERARALGAAYADSCNLRKACREAKVSKSTHYRWLKQFPTKDFPAGYAAFFEEHRKRAGDLLEDFAVERATTGWNEPVYYQGEVCGRVRRFSDGLLMQLLRGLKPEVYGVNRQEISGPQGAPVQARIEIVFVDPKQPD
jgi:hypothetical protein